MMTAYIKNFGYILCAMVLAFAAGMDYAKAEPYITAGVGKAVMQHPNSNKWWRQDGIGSWTDENSTTYVVGAGYQWEYLGVELNYSNGHEFNIFSGYIVNEDYYSPTAPGHCTHPDPAECRTSWGYQHGEVYMINLSFLPRYPITEKLAVFGRFGASFKSATMEHKHVDNRSVYEQDFATILWNDKGIGAVAGAGIQYGNFTFEFNRYPSARIRITPFQSSGWQWTDTYTINYRWSI